MQLIFPVAIGLVVYFFMIRPQQKRTADGKKFRESLAKGSRVVTIGGLHGLVVDLTDDTVVVEVDRGTKLRFRPLGHCPRSGHQSGRQRQLGP